MSVLQSLISPKERQGKKVITARGIHIWSPIQVLTLPNIVVVTFMSRDLSNHVLCRVCHLVDRIVVFLESRVFSSLSKLLHLATRIKVERKKSLSGILSYGRLFKWTNWSCGV